MYLQRKATSFLFVLCELYIYIIFYIMLLLYIKLHLYVNKGVLVKRLGGHASS